MGDVVLFSLLAALNPTLLAATTLMLLLPHPGRLMLGFWLGGFLTSVTFGLVIVFALEGSSLVGTTKNTLSPLGDFVLAAVLLIVAVVLAAGRDKSGEQKREGHRAKHGEVKEPRKWQQQLGKGTVKSTFVVGALLSLPGATYIAGLNNIRKLHYSTAVTVLLVIGFNLIQLVLIEIPIVALKVAPNRTPIAIEHAKEWARRHGRVYAAWGLVIVAVALGTKGVVEAA